MVVPKSTNPDLLFKFVAVRPPKVAATRPPLNILVLTRALFNTATDAEISAIEMANGQFLFSQLQSAYNEDNSTPNSLQNAFDSLTNEFKLSNYFFGNNNSNYFQVFDKIPLVWDWYLRSDRSASPTDFVAKFLEITGVSINSIVSDSNFKERKLRIWDNLLFVVIRNTPTEYQEMVCNGVLFLNTIEKLNTLFSDVDSPEKISISMARPVTYDDFIGDVIGYTERSDAETSDRSLENAIRIAGYLKITDLYGILSDLEEFELRENSGSITNVDDSPYYNNNYYNGDKSKNEAESGTTTSNDSNKPTISRLDQFYFIASSKTQYLMKQLRLESRNFSSGFISKMVQREIQKVYANFPTKPSTSGISIIIGGNIINYNTSCFTYTPPENPCDAANLGIDPKKLTTGIFQAAGYGDLLIVEQNLLKYDLGEVAHIENILKGEKKTRQHNRLDRVEETNVTETETTKETERESQTTERFSMEKETTSVVQQDMGFEAGLKVSANYGSVQLESNLGFSLNSSTTENTNTASKYAKDITIRALDRVIEKVRKLRTVTTIHEIKEFNEHILDNTAVADAGGINIQDNVSGVYRWVDKYYKCKIRNYGRRLMIEFIVPEPASFYIFAKANKPAEKINNPVDPRKLDDVIYPVKKISLGIRTPNNPNALDEINVLEWAKIYNVMDIIPLPDREIRISKNFDIPWDGGDAYKAITISKEKFFTAIDKYCAVKAHVRVSMSVGNGFASNIYLKIGSQNFKFWVYNTDANNHWNDVYPFTLNPVTQVENLSFYSGGGSSQIFHYDLQQEKYLIDVDSIGISKDLDVSVLTSNLTADYNLTIKYKLTKEAFLEWQLDAYNKIMTAYQKQLSEYEEWVNAQKIGSGITIEGNNPGINREIEKVELQKHCLTIFTGERLEWFNSMKSQQKSFGYPEIDLKSLPKQAAYIQFFEQAFEWNNITYRYYPYFWGRKAGWIVNSLMQDTDPIFTKFLQAGAARVVVPVRPGFEQAIATYMKTGKIWDGKPVPAPGTELYVSIVTEQKEDAGAGNFNYTGDEWELKVPTNLVYLQPLREQGDKNLPNYNPIQFPMDFV